MRRACRVYVDRVPGAWSEPCARRAAHELQEGDAGGEVWGFEAQEDGQNGCPQETCGRAVHRLSRHIKKGYALLLQGQDQVTCVCAMVTAPPENLLPLGPNLARVLFQDIRVSSVDVVFPTKDKKDAFYIEIQRSS
eukprot:TRINITY_DN4169_c0_g1_i12.p1 TRINITY_DN4169_c0_g1~~TRINITY_DN4169_c0_g1_i12.p1  ORF type:complete len:136 (-),score=7.32 TRINITY_DN4169_c0_g1_i12:174-581(-)